VPTADDPTSGGVAMKRSGWWALGAAVLVVLGWLGWERFGPRAPWPSPLSDLQVAEGWLHCIDCQGPFLKQLHEMPARSQDSVTRFLHAALVTGPDSARAARVTRDLVETWRAESLSRARRGEKPDTSFATFMQRYQDGFDARWRGRAAVALGVIRTPAALAALNDGLQLPLQDKGDSVVRRMVQRAIADSGLVVLGHYPP
jgi:hypothetical protein